MIATLGTPERQAGVGGARDRFRLAALLGADAGIGAGGIDDRQHGNAESIGHLHQPDRLAVALGPRHAEIMLDAGFGGGALFLADHADALAAEAAEPAHQRFVLAEFAVAGERREFGDQRIDEIGEMRALRVARHQRLLPRRQVGVELGERLRRLVLDSRDLVADVAAGRRQRAQFIDLGFEFGDGLFEIEVRAHEIRHQFNIGANAPESEAVVVRANKACIFNCLARNPGRGPRPFADYAPSCRGCETAVSGETAPKSRRQSGRYFSASGCRSRTRLFRRSSTTWV